MEEEIEVVEMRRAAEREEEKTWTKVREEKVGWEVWEHEEEKIKMMVAKRKEKMVEKQMNIGLEQSKKELKKQIAKKLLPNVRKTRRQKMIKRAKFSSRSQ